MEVWWSQQLDFLRDRVVSRQAVKRPAPAALPGPGPAGSPPGHPPAKAPKKNKLINGVPPAHCFPKIYQVADPELI